MSLSGRERAEGFLPNYAVFGHTRQQNRERERAEGFLSYCIVESNCNDAVEQPDHD